MDTAALADFLRRRRQSIQPEALGLVRGARRRATGLRREEVAERVGMSVDYYVRLEQDRGPQPSVQMVVAIARALQLGDDERDHLFRLAGHAPPERLTPVRSVSPTVLRVLDCVVGLVRSSSPTPVSSSLPTSSPSSSSTCRPIPPAPRPT